MKISHFHIHQVPAAVRFASKKQEKSILKAEYAIRTQTPPLPAVRFTHTTGFKGAMLKEKFLHDSPWISEPTI